MIVADLVALLLLATLAGVLASRRAWLCRSFVAYLALALLTNRLVRWWPDRFYTTSFFSAKEALFAALSLLIAVELVRTGLAPFPRARRTAAAVVLTIAAVGALGVLRAARADDYASRMGFFVAGAQLSSLLALVALLGVAQWYRLPLRPWHRSIMIGFVLYRGVYGLLLATLAEFGGPVHACVAALDRAAYAATVGVWLAAAWRPEWHDLTERAQAEMRALQRS